VLLRRLVEAGERVPVQAPIGVVGKDGEACDDAALRRLLAGSAAAKTSAVAPIAAAAPLAVVSANAPVAPAARKRAQELGVELASVRGTGKDGLVRVEDVERARAALAATDTDGTLDPVFLQHLQSDAEAFAALSSDFKVALYQKHGARIGSDCRIGKGTVLRAAKLALGDGACFGPDCTLDAREFTAGAMLHFGARCRIRVTRARLGDNAFFTDDVDIGGGGAMDPEALLQVGSHGFVGEHVHLNPCRPLVIGDEVVISRNAVIMTHSFGASVLQGYPNRFASVRIGDGAQVGIAAVLFPGCEVGDGAILLSGSSLVSAVPPGRLFGGVPAQDQKAAARPLSPAAMASLVRELVLEFARQLQLRGRVVEVTAGEAALEVKVTDGGNVHRLGFSADGAFAAAAGVVEDVRAAITFPAFEALPATVVGIELSVPRIRGAQGRLADAFREFLRKRGVRMQPRTWSYRGGWL
jgi:acetyltransferase-like isoleucine patch superfamily enzyme